MNTRIRQLAEQAGITTNLDTDFFEKDPNKWVEYYSEKFAELLIRECVDKMEGEDSFYGGWMGRVIKEHFGIQP
jgi:hypothetical protein